VILTILGFYWWDGYNNAKIQDGSITLGSYIKSDVLKMREAVKEIPDILEESTESADKIRIGSMNKLAEALEFYNMEKGRYPEDIEEIIGDYINSRIVKEESFYYEVKSGGNDYLMGIKLGSGEIYEIGN